MQDRAPSSQRTHEDLDLKTNDMGVRTISRQLGNGDVVRAFGALKRAST